MLEGVFVCEFDLPHLYPHLHPPQKHAGLNYQVWTLCCGQNKHKLTPRFKGKTALTLVEKFREVLFKESNTLIQHGFIKLTKANNKDL